MDGNRCLEQLHWFSVHDPAKYFWHPRLIIYFFPIRLKLGLQTGERLLIGAHLDISNYLANQTAGVRLCCAFYRAQNPAGPNPFCWAKPACFNFSSSNFVLLGHILCTSGSALTLVLSSLTLLLRDCWIVLCESFFCSFVSSFDTRDSWVVLTTSVS